MKGKVCMITGATSGLGRETTLGLARLGASIVFVSRSDSKGTATRADLIERSGNSDIDFIICDLSSLQAVRNCADRFKEGHDRLDVLINDAGTWERRRSLSKDGIELTFAVNHLSHFLLTNLLLDLMKRSAPSRIIGVSSGLHGGTINFDDIGFERGFSGLKAYRQSKLANLLFTKELARRLAGTSVTANCIMPGMVRTNLGRNSRVVSKAFFKAFGTKPEKAARIPIRLASSPDVEAISGECFTKRGITSTSAESNDPELARRLWEVSTAYVQKWL